MQMFWELVRFCTYGQIINLWRLCLYVNDLLCHLLIHNLNRLLQAVGSPRQLNELVPRALPQAELAQMGLWCMMVWVWCMQIAMWEERQLWLDANPRTASYVRGLRYRDPYSKWSPFTVDWSLLEPGVDRLGLWLHHVVFRPGLAAVTGLKGATVFQTIKCVLKWLVRFIFLTLLA